MADRRTAPRTLIALAALATFLWTTDPALAGRKVRNTTRTNVGASRNVNLDRNVAVNRHLDRDIDFHHDVDIHRDIDIDVDVDHDWHDDWDDHPIARGVAFGAAAAVTAAVVGSIVYSLPPTCVATVVNGVTYQQCGAAWYQPQYVGTQVTYVVVNPP